MSVCFPGLKKESRPLLGWLSHMFGVVLEPPQKAALVVTKVVGLPSVGVIMQDIFDLLKEILLPLLDGGWIRGLSTKGYQINATFANTRDTLSDLTSCMSFKD